MSISAFTRSSIWSRPSALLIFLTSAIIALTGQAPRSLATEKPSKGNNQQHSQEQGQEQYQNQFQEQEQYQSQQQGDNQVNVDGDDNDYFALALPGLVAANCAGSSYSVGGGGAGFGLGFGQALIDENCQIAKAIATAHLLDGAGLIHLKSREYREALCQMRGMEHVCKGGKHGHGHRYPKWCWHRIKNDTKASQWSKRDLKACGLGYETFELDREARKKAMLNKHKVVIAEQHEQKHEYGHGMHHKGKGHGGKRFWKYHENDPHLGDKKHDHDGWSHRHKYVKKHGGGHSYKTSSGPVRVGKHKGYDRIVFDWQKRVSYTTEQVGETVVISFRDMGAIDVSRIARDLGDYVLDARTEKQGDKTNVILTVLPETDFSILQWKGKVIVDVRGDCDCVS